MAATEVVARRGYAPAPPRMAPRTRRGLSKRASSNTRSGSHRGTGTASRGWQRQHTYQLPQNLGELFHRPPHGGLFPQAGLATRWYGRRTHPARAASRPSRTLRCDLTNVVAPGPTPTPPL